MVEPESESLSCLFTPTPGVTVAGPEAGSTRIRAELTSGRRPLLAAALAPALLWFYDGALGAPLLQHPGWAAALVAMAVMGALTWSTYLPAAGRVSALASPCTAIAGIFPVMAGVGLSDAWPSPAAGMIAFAMVAFGLVQRLRPAAC